jgi:NAD(P)-dependent dehydrogenase (short-subunit alcohol dehydrogenase family)
VLSKELSGQGIRVNALAPAMVQSPLLAAYFDFLGPEAEEKERRAYPFGLGLPSDVANMAAYLLSGAARWITGQLIAMDGGRY